LELNCFNILDFSFVKCTLIFPTKLKKLTNSLNLCWCIPLSSRSRGKHNLQHHVNLCWCILYLLDQEENTTYNIMYRWVGVHAGVYQIGQRTEKFKILDFIFYLIWFLFRCIWGPKTFQIVVCSSFLVKSMNYHLTCGEKNY